MREAQLAKLEGEVLDMLCTKALTLARLANSADFAQVLLATLPAGPQPNSVWLDMAELTTQELWALARVGNPELPDLSAMSPGQLRAYVMEHA